MAAQDIQWRHSLEEAREQARQQGKLVLIDLFSPKWNACKKMDAVTYSNGDVETFIEERFIPVRFDRLEQPEVMEQFHASKTPTIIVEDAEGQEQKRNVGYLDPQSFVGELSP